MNKAELVAMREALETKRSQEITDIDRLKQIKNELSDVLYTAILTEEEHYELLLDELKQFIPRTDYELKIILETRGLLWRQFHKKTKTENRETFNQETSKSEKEKVAVLERVLPVPPRTIADILKEHCHFSRIARQVTPTTPPYIYQIDLGTYTPNIDIIDRYILIVQRDTTMKSQNEIRNWIKKEIEFNEPTLDENITVMNNGLFDIQKKELLPFTHEKYFIARNSVNYADTPHPNFSDGFRFDDFINTVSNGDKESAQAIWQVIQYALLTNKIKLVFVYFYSEKGRTGKGTIVEFLKNLVGFENTGVSTIEQLNEKYMIASIYDKSLIIGDENDGVYVVSNSSMKTIASGDSIKVEPKYMQPFWAECRGLIVQNMNGLPTFKDLDNATRNRMRIIELKKSFYGDDNENIKKIYTKDRQLLEWIAFKALNMPVEKFHDTPDSLRIKGELEEDNNPVLAFYKEIFVKYTSKRLPNKFVFYHFRAWLYWNNQPDKWKQQTFTREIKKVLAEHGKEWKYSKSDLAPKEFFTAADRDFFDDYTENMDLVKRHQIEHGYDPKKDSKQQQPLLFIS